MRQVRTVAIVMPARNEAAVVGHVVAQIPAEVNHFTTIPIVVDDGSTDSTGDVARMAGARVLRHITNLGVGMATITGLKAAQQLNADVIVTMDADGQHDPREIEKLVRCLIEGDFDVVIGSRMFSRDGMPLSRVAANLLLNLLTFAAYGKIVSDSQSGFKVFSRQALAAMDLNSSGYEICSEIVGEIYRKNLRYKSVPISAVYTPYSRAKGQHFLNGINLILGLFIRLVRRT
jgi:glycosyltransferase involved in cell wall biosynthesis